MLLGLVMVFVDVDFCVLSSRAWSIQPSQSLFYRRSCKVRLLTGMGSSHVNCHLSATCKGSSTRCARKRLLTCVDSYMLSQVFCPGKSFPAGIARMCNTCGKRFAYLTFFLFFFFFTNNSNSFVLIILFRKT